MCEMSCVSCVRGTTEEATEEAEEEEEEEPGVSEQKQKPQTKMWGTQKQHPVHRVLHLLRKKVRGPAEAVDHRQRPGSLSAAPATQKQHPVLRVLHLPRNKVRCVR